MHAIFDTISMQYICYSAISIPRISVFSGCHYNICYFYLKVLFNIGACESDSFCLITSISCRLITLLILHILFDSCTRMHIDLQSTSFIKVLLASWSFKLGHLKKNGADMLKNDLRMI